MGTIVKDYMPKDGYGGVLRYSNGKNSVEYIAKEDGVYEEWDEVDQFGEPMFRLTQMVLPKEVFMVAYNAYIKNEK